MAQSITSQSLAHHAHSSHNHHPSQGINSAHHNHHSQHSGPMHTSVVDHAFHTASSSQNSHQKPSQDNDEEAIARKKKNADAQAAFRQRRQTYIKSLEDTVTELKSAVTEMEEIVKTTSQEAKLHRTQVEFLESKLAAYEGEESKNGVFEQHHCKCCKFAPQDFTPRLPPPLKDGQNLNKTLRTPSTSTLAMNSATDCPMPSGPSTVTPPNVTSQEGISREWQPRQAISSIYPPGTGSRSASHNHLAQDSSNDPPHSTKSLDYPRNILHQHASSPLHNSSYPRSNCDLALFTSFGATENSSIPHFYPVTEGSHGAPAQSTAHNSSPSGVCNSLELGHHPTHLQPILTHAYDRSPPLRQPNSLGTAYSPLGPPQSFDPNHSGTLPSPRMWSSNHHNHHITGPEPHSGSHLDSSPKTALYSLDGSVAHAGPSRFRMHQGITERSIMRQADYLPSLELRPIPQSYPMIPSLVSPSTDTPAGGVSFKSRTALLKRRREWGDEKFDLKHDTRETDDALNSMKTSGGGKLNGLPAKVAHCVQTVKEVSQSVSHAKEEFQALTAASSNTISTARHSVSPNSTVSNGFMDLPDPSRDHSKYQRMKLNLSTHHLVSSAASTLAAPQSQSHDERQIGLLNHHR